jgi:glycosyltransferase involved in cell wall biosynthesis
MPSPVTSAKTSAAAEAPTRVYPDPTISVIMPVYNKVAFVGRAVASVLAQTVEDFELIIVDDGSTDGSKEFLRTLPDPRIHLYHRDTPGPGGYAARNYGLSVARTRWIAFLDADDEWYPHHLASARSALAAYPNCFLFIFRYQTMRGGVLTEKGGDTGDGPISRLRALVLYSENDIVHTNCFVVEKSSLERTGGFPAGRFKRGGDAAVWLRLLFATDGIFMSSEVTSVWHIDRSEIISEPKNTDSAHPVGLVVRELLETQSLGRGEHRALKRLANRKAYSWSVYRKRAGIFHLTETVNFYPSVFSFKDWVGFVSLLLPVPVYLRLSRLFRPTV